VGLACRKSSVATLDSPRRERARTFLDPSDARSRYAAGMTLGLTLLQTEVTRELPIPAWAFGLLAFSMLTILLLITWSIGRGRPHS
jgi:hypothetical protein